MKSIEKIKLKNFKRFKTLELEFNQEINILIGDNESGKSSILSAINLVLSGSVNKIESVGLESLFNSEVINNFLTVMTERILKTAISNLEAFNDVRNNQSFAHDNSILNYHESLLIFRSISSIVEFINSIEEPPTKAVRVDEVKSSEDELPF